MNEDYLWDKTGRDPEIEEFEQALKGFAYRETSPPALPAKVVAFTPKPAPRIFRYAVAAAACLAFFAISFGIWLQLSTPDAEDEIAAKNTMRQRGEIISAPAAVKEGSPVTATQPSLKQTDPGVEKTVLLAAHKNTPKKQYFRPAKAAVKLTREEVYAYGQLKLALAITGSQLKLIKDKVESGDDNKAPFKTLKAVKNGR